jgi:hypothetical protein
MSDSPPKQALVFGTLARIKGALTIKASGPNIIASLSNTGVTPGSYTSGNFTVGADGRLSVATNGGGGISGSGTSGQVTFWNGTSSITGNAQFTYSAGALTLGSSANAGTLILNGSSSGTLTLQTAAAAGTSTIFQFPSANGSSGNLLLNTGSNASAWAAMSGDATIISSGAITLATVNGSPGTYTYASVTVNGKGLVTSATSGTAPVTGTATSGQVTYWNGTGTVTGSTNFTFAAGALTLGTGASAGSIVLNGSSSGTLTLQTAAAAGTSTIFQFPSANGSSGNLLINQGSNASAWQALSGDATLVSSGAITLATVNTNVGSFTYASITVNGKGLITAAANGTAPVTGTGVSGQVSYWNGTSTQTGSADFTFASGVITLGVNGVDQGSVVFKGATSGATTVVPAAAAGGTFTFPSVSWTGPTVQAPNSSYVQSVNASGVAKYVPLYTDPFAYAAYGAA